MRVSKSDLLEYALLRDEISSAYANQRISNEEKETIESFLYNCVFKQDEFPTDDIVQISNKIWLDEECVI